MRKYLSATLSILTILILFYTIIDLTNQVRTYKKDSVEMMNRLDSMTLANDSLVDQVFIKSVELGRIEVATNQVLSKYPTIYEKYHQHLETQTE